MRWRASRGEEGREVRPLSPGLPFPASSNRDLRSYQGLSSASWGGERGLRRVSLDLDQQATSSRDSLWPYSVGMLRLSWVVPPAQVEPTPDLPCVYVQLLLYEIHKSFSCSIVLGGEVPPPPPPINFGGLSTDVICKQSMLTMKLTDQFDQITS